MRNTEKEILTEDVGFCKRPDLRVLMKKVYGNERFYPFNDLAKTVCNLMKVQTFTKDQLKFCKDSGWKISIETEEYKLD